MMKVSRDNEYYMRKQRVKGEHKQMSSKIKDLESKMNDSKLNQTQSSAAKDGGESSKQDIEAQYDLLLKTKKQLEYDLQETRKEMNRKIEAEDQVFHEINRYAIIVQSEREKSKIQLKKNEIKLAHENRSEKILDEEIFKILGKRLTMSDLEKKYA